MITTIRGKIVCFCVIIVVASTMITGVIGYTVSAWANTAIIKSNAGALANSLSRDITTWVLASQQMVVSLTTPAAESDPVPALRQIRDAGHFTNVYVGFSDKTMKMANSVQLPPNFDPTSRPWYRLVAEKHSPAVTPPYVVMPSGRLVVSFTAPVMVEGTLKGVVSGDVSMDTVIEIVRSIHPTKSSFAFLVDGQNRIIAHPDASFTLKPVQQLAESLTRERLAALVTSGDVEGAKVGSQNLLLRAVSIPGTDWTAVLALDADDVNAGLKSILIWVTFATACVTFFAAILVWGVMARTFRRLADVQHAMQEIGRGTADLTQRLRDEGRDEVSQIANSFNTFVEQIHALLIKVNFAAVSVTRAADEIASGNVDLSSRTEQAAASLQETASATSEIAQAVQQTSSAAEYANKTTDDVRRIAKTGLDIVSKAVVTMERVEITSGKVAEITTLIDGIAFQTNILALNAAVESARAGEQGRGFAVVAAEVRSLAQRSSQAAKQIKALIDESAESVRDGSTLIREAGAFMDRTLAGIDRVAEIMDKVTETAIEQAQGISDVNRAVSHLDEMTQRNAALVEQSAAAAESLRDQATSMINEIGGFSL